MSLFGDYGPSYLGMPSGASGDVTIAVQDFTTGTSTDTQNYTSATISGLTPAGVLILAPNHDPTNDPGETAIMSLGVGMVVGTEDVSCGAWSRENNATTSNAKFGATGNKAYEVKDNSGSGTKDAQGQTISGGVQLTYNANTSPSLRGVFAAFAGSDVSAAAKANDMDGSVVGFEPDVVIMANPHMDLISLTLGLSYSFGIAVNDGSQTQRCVMWAEANGLADSKPFQQLRNDCIGGVLDETTGAPTYKLVVDAFDADGFDVTPSAGTGTDEICFLALKFTGRQFKLVDFNTPTSTGPFTITGAGFTPRFALIVGTNLEAVNNDPASTTSDLQSGLSICLVGSDEQWAASWRINAGEATTDTASQLTAAALMGASATDCDAILGTFTAWTSDGMTVEVTATQGAAKKFFALFVE